MTTRSEKKAAARRRILYQLEAWLEELEEHIKKGKTPQQAFDILNEDLDRAIKENPQEKSMLIDAWKEFNEFLEPFKMCGVNTE